MKKFIIVPLFFLLTSVTYATISWPWTPDGETAWWNIGSIISAITIDSWNVGIWKTPLVKFDVNWDISATNIAWILSTTTQSNITSLWTLSSLQVTWNSTFDTTTFFVDSTNNRVWIGTITPAVDLDVNDTDTSHIRAIITWQTNNPSIYMLADETNNKWWIYSTAPKLELGANNSIHMTVVSTGAIGIWMTTPTERLTIKSPTSDTDTFSIYWSLDNKKIASIWDYNAWVSIWELSLFMSDTKKVRLSASGYSHFLGGNVWIGTTYPSEKLEITWAIKIWNTTNTTAWNIRWSWADFEGYNGTLWKSLTSAWADTWPPIGSIMAFSLDNCPAWWALADGTNGGTYKPDLRGRFVRWIDPTWTNDAVRAVTNIQNDTFQGHHHNLLYNYNSSLGTNSNQSPSTSNWPDMDTPSQQIKNPTNDGTNGDPRTASETRPKNVSLTYCIKVSEGAGTSLWNLNGNNINFTSGNVGIWTSSPSTTLEVNGFTKLWNDAPALKSKLITGTTPWTQWGTISIAHGLDSSKILSVNGGTYRSSDWEFAPFGQWPLAGNVEARLLVNSTNVSVYLSAWNSSSMLNHPFKILIWYME